MRRSVFATGAQAGHMLEGQYLYGKATCPPGHPQMNWAKPTVQKSALDRPANRKAT